MYFLLTVAMVGKIPTLPTLQLLMGAEKKS
jgi:hypothetical protein